MTIATEVVLYGGCLPAVPFRELVVAAAAAGFDALSVWPLMYRRAISREGLTPEGMRAVVDDAGVRVTDLDPCGDWLPSRDEQGDRATPFRSIWTRHDFFDAAAALGADTIVAVDLTGGPVAADVAVEGFAALCDDAAEHGLRVALEFMPFSGIPDLAAAWHVVATTGRDNGGIVLDACHLARSGGAPASVAAVPADRVFAVQLADGPAHAPDDLMDEAMFHRAAPGDGDFDIAGLVARLEGMGVRTRVGPELYRRGWSERPPADVAADLMIATRRVLDPNGDHA